MNFRITWLAEFCLNPSLANHDCSLVTHLSARLKVKEEALRLSDREMESYVLLGAETKFQRVEFFWTLQPGFRRDV